MKYEPENLWFGISARLNGENYYCSVCCRYVSALKWHGGLVEMRRHTTGGKPQGTKMVYKRYNFCPCCGVKMRFYNKSRNKKKFGIKRIETSIKEILISPTVV